MRRILGQRFLPPISLSSKTKIWNSRKPIIPVTFFSRSFSSDANDDILARAKNLFQEHPTEDPRALSRRKFRRLAKLSPLSKALPEEEEVDEAIIEAWVELYQGAADQLAYDNTASPIGVTHVEHRDPQQTDEVLLDEMSRPITFDHDSDSDDKTKK